MMDILIWGIRNQNSSRWYIRHIAELIQKLCIRYADLEESRLNRKKIDITHGSLSEEEMLQGIQDKIAGYRSKNYP